MNRGASCLLRTASARGRLRLLFGLGFLICVGSPGLAAVTPRVTGVVEYSGMCDASGAVAVSSNLFVAASDEDNVLRLYRSDHPGPPVKQFDCNAFLKLNGKSLEADLEAGARIGDRAYWIGSHGRNRNGKRRSNRCRFFATDILVQNGEVTLVPVGRPCQTLLEAMEADGRFAAFHLEEAARFAPKGEEGLNIEGLAATAEGGLLIGFRNPVPQDRALVIPLRNPDEVVAGRKPIFGTPILLDLGGLSIRDLAWFAASYVIIAGPWHTGGPFRFYRWPGPGAAPQPLAVEPPRECTPEALIIYPEKGLREFQVLSDDGSRVIDGRPGKEIRDPERQKFRSFWVKTQ